MEYGQMARYYDVLYRDKDYNREVAFLKSFFPKNSKRALDLGCGTGEHLRLLKAHPLESTGVDISPEMIAIAKTKIPADFIISDILTYRSRKKFDIIISMFAVCNHLSSEKELKEMLCHVKEMLKKNGVIILDFHNPAAGGEKRDRMNGVERTMKWRVNSAQKKEYSEITYTVDGHVFKTRHQFTIYTIEQLTKLSEDLAFRLIGFYENYTLTPATNASKNIQMVLKK